MRTWPWYPLSIHVNIDSPNWSYDKLSMSNTKLTFHWRHCISFCASLIGRNIVCFQIFPFYYCISDDFSNLFKAFRHRHGNTAYKEMDSHAFSHLTYTHPDDMLLYIHEHSYKCNFLKCRLCILYRPSFKSILLWVL